MAVWREGSGRRPWRCRYYDLEGRERQRSFATRKLADEFERTMAEKKARVSAGLPVQAGPISYDALCQLFLDGYTARSKPWKEQMLGYSRERFGKVPVHLLRSEQIAAWLHTELDRLSPKTRNSILGAMRQVCSAAVEWHYLTQSPVRPAAVKPPPARIPDVFPLESWAEVLRVAEAAGYYGPLIRFVCATGLRFPEWSQLEWQDVDLRAGVVSVAGEKTENARRVVVLSKAAIRALGDLPRRIDTPLVFTGPTGRQINTKKWGEKYWKPALVSAGLHPRPARQMRHTYATLALAQGCTIEWISKQMGHKGIEITLHHYARFVKRVDDRMRALLDEMEDADVQQDIHHSHH